VYCSRGRGRLVGRLVGWFQLMVIRGERADGDDGGGDDDSNLHRSEHYRNRNPAEKNPKSFDSRSVGDRTKLTLYIVFLSPLSLLACLRLAATR